MAHESAQVTPPVMSNEILSIEEINARFDGEWVLLENPWFGSGQQVLGGTLLSHSKEKNEVYGRAMVLRPTRAACFYVGRGDQDMAYLL